MAWSRDKKLRRPIEEVRKELLSDPTTQHIASTLKMTVQDYVEKVLDYATHPEKLPQLQILPDEQVRAAGGSTVAEVKAWLEKAARGEIDLRPAREKDAFEDVAGKKKT
jgi:hypothetical protein